MSRNPSLQSLEDEERHARNRLALYRARLYGGPPVPDVTARRRLGTLQRRWELAADRLRRARSGDAR